MTFRYVILPEKRLIVQRFTGLVTIEDVIRCTEELWADPLYQKAYDGISDLREVQTTIQPQDVMTLAKFLWNPSTSVGKWAAILSEPRTTALGLLVMRATLMMAIGLKIFSTWEAGCAYIRAEVPPLMVE